MGAGWSGHPNGQIPLERMSAVRGEPFQPHAAAWLRRLEKAFAARFGHEFVILEGYRSLKRQQELYALWLAGKGNTAAPPGTSNHGEGIAGDAASNIDHKASDEHQWIVAHGPACHWIPDLVAGEPWHLTYTGPTSGPLPDTEDDMPITDAEWVKLKQLILDQSTLAMKQQLAPSGEVWHRLQGQLLNPILAAIKAAVAALKSDGK